MRSLLDWLAGFYPPERNPYLRLSEEDRATFGIRALLFFAVIIVSFAIWHWLA